MEQREKDFLIRFLENPPLPPEQIVNVAQYTGLTLMAAAAVIRLFFLVKRKTPFIKILMIFNKEEGWGPESNIVIGLLVLGGLVLFFSVGLRMFYGIKMPGTI